MPSLVAFDLETTGLDPQTDTIIEIGAVRFNGRRVEAEFSTLINPGRPIPPFITQLTGITDQMVREAPPIRSVVSDLKAFIGDSTVLGHNVRFDLSFARKYGIAGLNDYVDTYEMASILLPSAERYNLGALGQKLGVPLPATHRALDDARVTRAIYQILFDELLKLPLHVLAEIVRLSDNVADWGGYYAFYEALRTRSKEKIGAKQAREGFFGPLFDAQGKRGAPPLQANATLYTLDEDEVASILEHGGPFSRHFPQYEHRPQQVEMLRAVTNALNEGRHLMVEAGTGTGKSYAYLVPAALWAMENNARVVISTNTINLQEQLIQKDIPELRKALDIDLRAAVLKGRANYLCPRRMQNLIRRGPQSPDELRVLAKLLVWLQQGGSGDRAQINLNGPIEGDAWWRLSADDEACTSENCMKHTGGNCPFYRAKQAAQSAHIVIVNHALLLSDVAVGGRVLPEYDYVIIDEAHHIEDATTNALSFHATQGEFDRALRELGGSNAGALGRLLAALEGILSPSEFGSISQLVRHATDYAFNVENLSRDFFTAIDQFLAELREGKPVGLYAHQERILPATRALPAWTQVELAWDEAEKSLRPLIEILGQLLEGLAQLLNEPSEALPEDIEEVLGNLSNLYRRVSELHDNLEGLVFKPKPDQIYWAEINPNGRRLALHAAPLHVGPLMEQHLWHQKTCVILTSATMTANNEFDYMRGRLYAADADELVLGSPFDYESAALLYIANDIPEPSDRHGHQRAIEHGLTQLCTATGGRTLVLFTSYDQLKRTAQAIGPALARHDIRVYEQGEGASASALLESFKNTERAVLLGTRSFWEGVDIPGEALSVLVITKLPFAVPSDPIVAARSETFEDAFNEYSLPEAILRFRQGFGRLIRTQSDHGIVAIFDRRVLTKRYGRMFIESLPGCTARQGPLSELPRQAVKWLNL
ncbi:MAG: helicase C-terminal domain-containing protein [Chloroflexota bacterium]